MYFDFHGISAVTDTAAQTFAEDDCVLVALFGNLKARIVSGNTAGWQWQSYVSAEPDAIIWQAHNGIAPWCKDGSGLEPQKIKTEVVYDRYSDKWGLDNTLYLISRGLDKEKAGDGSIISATIVDLVASADLAEVE